MSERPEQGIVGRAMAIERKHKVIIVVASTVAGVLIFGSIALFAVWLRKASARAADARAEGNVYATQHDADGCVSDGLRRMNSSGLGSEAATQAFLRACLAIAPRPPGFCASVPPKDEIMKSAHFGIQFCAQRGRGGDRSCARIFAQVLPEACSVPAPSTRP
jgi:hypothetical protein